MQRRALYGCGLHAVRLTRGKPEVQIHDRNLIVVQAVRPKLAMPKSIEEAAAAVDEMFNTVMQNAGCKRFPQTFLS